jgi:hypothetical protein
VFARDYLKLTQGLCLPGMFVSNYKLFDLFNKSFRSSPKFLIFNAGTTDLFAIISSMLPNSLIDQSAHFHLFVWIEYGLLVAKVLPYCILIASFVAF